MVAAVQLDVTVARDTLAEWLRRRPAKPMGSPRVGSNPTGVVRTCDISNKIIIDNTKAKSLIILKHALRASWATLAASMTRKAAQAGNRASKTEH